MSSIENFRPGTMDRLGWGHDRCSALNPRLVWCAITGFGPGGPYTNIRACDPVVQAACGVAAARAITAALFARERTGQGQRIDLSMLDSAIAFNWPESMCNHAFVEPADPFPEYGSLTRLWPAKDGLASMAGRLRNLATLLQAMGAEVARRTRAELMEGFTAAGAVGCTVNSCSELLADPQVLHNGSIVTVDQGDLGPVRVARHPARFSATPARGPTPAPALGRNGKG